MFCQSCGQENPAAAEFCQDCGKPIPRHAAAPAPLADRVAPAAPTTLYAGFWLRFAAILIDGIIWNLAVTLVVVLLIMFAFASVMAGGNVVAIVMIGLIAGIGIYLGWFFYHAYCESSDWQGSIGKRALGLYVTDTRGQRITFGRAAGRNFSRILSDWTALVGYIMAGFTAKKQSLHDMVADCLVLRRP